MHLKKIALAAAAALLCFTQASAQEVKTRGKLIKENEDLRSQVDSLMIELENLKKMGEIQDSLFYSQEEEYETENFFSLPDFTPEETDSLLNIWYVHKQIENTKDFFDYDMDAEVFTSNVPDSVLKERLEKMNSFISLPFNETVKNYMVLYSEKMPTKMGHILGLCTYYMPIFEEIFNKYDLPEELKVLPIIESAMNPVAVSRAGAKGMWQFMHNTGKNYGLKIDSFVDERLDIEKAADAAARYLRDSYKIFGDWCLAISSYNCGPGNVNKAIKRAGGKKDFWSIYEYLPRETRGYMPAFVGALYAINYYKEYGIVPEAVQMPAHTDTFEIHKNLHFRQISDVIGIPMEELKNLNPQYTHDIIPASDDPYVLTLPYTYTNAFMDNQDSIYAYKVDELIADKVVENKSTSGKTSSTSSQERISYKVKKGDYLGRIASRYGVTVRQLQQWNGLKGTNVRIGQVLYIYKNGAGPSKSTSSSSNSSTGYTTYTVRSGDNLTKIAAKYPGVTANDIMKINSISANIRPGMKLKIPQK